MLGGGKHNHPGLEFTKSPALLGLNVEKKNLTKQRTDSQNIIIENFSAILFL